MNFELAQSDVYSAIGLIGAGLYVVGYAALQFGVIAGRSYWYSAINLAAASCVLISLITHFNLSSAVIQTFWITLSLAGIIRIYWVTSRVKFTDEEQAFIQSKFPSISKPTARRFLDSGCWIDGKARTTLVSEGHPVTELIYLAEGEARATLNACHVGDCQPGSLIGEVTCLTGEPASATVTTVGDSRYFCIGTGRVRQLYNQNSDMKSALDAAFAFETGRKLRAANVSTGMPTPPEAGHVS